MVIIIYNRIDRGVALTCFKCVIAMFALWYIYKGAFLILDEEKRYNSKWLVYQQDYGTYDVDTFEIDGTTFYYPVSGDQVGYAPFPSSAKDMTGQIELIDGSVESGFKSIESE
ncbi:hypothetical protein D6853_02375 [Butyrivibrio sp. X503]|uniref:hypothetical protein n=1 Tax=Butyrivibrio sp. X503 TaxID=2364878 RepID=UPI000EA9293B|nr:hypothetical protein [Butyrivibrio sp. X503]RKM58399.1 hypothetical protein D6853_02375 [Butyrivibrio sp. X503]